MGRRSSRTISNCRIGELQVELTKCTEREVYMKPFRLDWPSAAYLARKRGFPSEMNGIF